MADSQSAGHLAARDIWEILPKPRWRSGRPERLWLHMLLFLITLLTTTVFGFALTESFRAGIPFNLDWLFDGYVRLAHLDPSLLDGLWFSAPLLLILLAHEFGHYLACRGWQVDASLPFFLPSPLLLGTFGAFIRIRAPIYTRRSLLDIGASGPFAGFVVLLPFLVIGTRLSHLSHLGTAPDVISFGTPLLLRAAEWLHFGRVDPADIQLHPMAMAAWAGLLATSMNLLPMGQLDGGHILYAALGERYHRVIALAAIGGLVLLGFAYRAWWIWAVVMFLFGRRHPLVYDQTPLRGWRVALSIASFFLLIISLAVVPVSTR
ncbi:MAG: peptidase [Bryobacterales bacterium]|nr:peptidase [Bryobacterales bacterium]